MPGVWKKQGLLYLIPAERPAQPPADAKAAEETKP
jgi:hypothetical protein